MVGKLKKPLWCCGRGSVCGVSPRQEIEEREDRQTSDESDMVSTLQNDRRQIQFACVCGWCGEKVNSPLRSVLRMEECGQGDSIELICGHVIHAFDYCHLSSEREAERLTAEGDCPICPKLLKGLAQEIAKSAMKTLTNKTGLMTEVEDEGEGVTSMSAESLELQLNLEREDMDREALGNETPLADQTRQGQERRLQ